MRTATTAAHGWTEANMIYDKSKVHQDVSIMVCNLTKGFCWWDENGERHDEDGFTMPEMKLFKGDVEEFYNGSERSAGWVSYQE